MTKLLTKRIVAEALVVTPRCVERWVKSGKLPAVKLSARAIRFRERDVERFIEEHGEGRQ
jgi:excisionase family DNA binding protein